MKRCTHCGESKRDSEFHNSGYKKKNKSESLHSWCKECVAGKPSYQKEYWSKPENKARKKKNAHKSYLRNKSIIAERCRESAYKRKFGITVAQYDAMLESQRGVCAICGRPPGKKRLHVDHDHKTGAVRALLCIGCNMTLGAARDEPTILRLAALYLEEHAVE